MTPHLLEKRVATNPDCEIRRDSSPLICDGWKAQMPDSAPPELAQFAAFVATAAEFAAATRRTVDFVAHPIEPMTRRAG